MSARTAALALAILTLTGCGYNLPTYPAERPFDFETDRFAFANETVWNYVDGEIRPGDERAASVERRYTRRCFVMCRAALEFWKFARFEPGEQPLSQEEIAARIREVTRLAEWNDPLPCERRVEFPGFADVHELSAAHPDAFKKNLGSGWVTYFRPGNFVIAFPPTDEHQEGVHLALQESLALAHPMVLWLVNFPSLNMNHAVLVYACRRDADDYVYTAYDPNDEIAPKHLTYSPARRSFSFERTFYFVGGEVDVRQARRGVRAALFQRPSGPRGLPRFRGGAADSIGHSA